MRAALNVAALQCQFEPMLATVANYNAILKDHDAELKGAFDTLGAYFKRKNKTPREGQMALDQYGTRTYSSFAAVAAQLNFCQTAGSIAHAAVFTPRGHLGELAVERMRELRNSLTPYGEQRFPRYIGREQHIVATMPRLDALCWNKKAEWVAKKCGAQNWPPPARPPSPRAEVKSSPIRGGGSAKALTEGGFRWERPAWKRPLHHRFAAVPLPVPGRMKAPLPFRRNIC